MQVNAMLGIVMLVLGLLLAVRSGCQEAESPETQATMEDAADASTRAFNMLTAEEKAEGWILLFDGQRFEHWRGYRRDSMPPGWTIDDQAIYCTGDGDEDDLITKETFGSFELQLDWKISEGGNSGIFYHVVEAPEYNEPWNTGPEVQVMDNERHPDRLNGDDRLAGGNYDMHAPSKNVAKPAEAWNHLRIVVDGNHVEHWLNGEKIVEYEKGGEDWKRRLAESKWSEYPSYAMSDTGHIGLQDHGDPVWFRNVKVRRLAGGEAM